MIHFPCSIYSLSNLLNYSVIIWLYSSFFRLFHRRSSNCYTKMFHLESPIPSISISPAPPKEPSPIEPQRSPYAVTLAPTHTESPRSQHLLPPPSPHHRSSAKPTIGISHGSGLDMAVFQALLQAAKGKEKDKGTKTSDGLKDSHHQVTSQRQTKQSMPASYSSFIHVRDCLNAHCSGTSCPIFSQDSRNAESLRNEHTAHTTGIACRLPFITPFSKIATTLRDLSPRK